MEYAADTGKPMWPMLLIVPLASAVVCIPYFFIFGLIFGFIELSTSFILTVILIIAAIVLLCGTGGTIIIIFFQDR